MHIMSADTKTRQRDPDNVKPHKDPLFERLPPEYYSYALQWFAYPRWTIEETANLLTGCVPHREMFLRGDNHRALDDDVLQNENRVRAALGNALRLVENKKYFARTFIDAANIVDWAIGEGIDVPEALIQAQKEFRQHREMHGYTTPCMQALDWVVERYWKDADLRDPASPGEIINALLQQFPDLSPRECEMIEHIARYPASRNADL